MSSGDWIVIAILAVVVVLCVRNLIKQKKNGGCSGNCAGCSHCQPQNVGKDGTEHSCSCKK